MPWQAKIGGLEPGHINPINRQRYQADNVPENRDKELGCCDRHHHQSRQEHEHPLFTPHMLVNY